jgi:hypothetical protein
VITINWRKDMFAEQTMRKYGIKWEVCNAQVDSIITEGNLARIPQNDQVEIGYDIACAMENGDAIPMLVLLKKNQDQFIVFAGHHRIAAVRLCSAKTITAYIIESDDEKVLKTLPFSLNPARREQSRHERIVLAIASMDSGLTIEQVSSLFSISVQSIRDEKKLQETRLELRNLGIRENLLTDTSVVELGRIKNTNILPAAARVVAIAKLTTDEVKQFCRAIRNEKTESQMSAVVAQKEKLYGINDNSQQVDMPKDKAKNPVGRQIKSALSTFEKNINVRTINQWGITSRAEKEEFISRGIKICNELIKILQRSKKESEDYRKKVA